MPSPDQAPSAESISPLSARDVKEAFAHGIGELARRKQQLADDVEQTTYGRRETCHIPSAGGISTFPGLEGAVGKAASTALRQPPEAQ